MDVKLFSGLEYRERYPTIFRHGPIFGTFRGPHGTWNLETVRVCYLIWSIFGQMANIFVLTQFLGTIFLISNSEWSETKLPDFWTVLTFPDWGLNSDRIRHIFDKNTEKLDFRPIGKFSQNCSINYTALCSWPLALHSLQCCTLLRTLELVLVGYAVTELPWKMDNYLSLAS